MEGTTILAAVLFGPHVFVRELLSHKGLVELARIFLRGVRPNNSFVCMSQMQSLRNSADFDAGNSLTGRGRGPLSLAGRTVHVL